MININRRGVALTSSFTFSRLHIDRIVKYNMGQPAHPKRQSFKEEYLSFLKKIEVEYDDKYLFE